MKKYILLILMLFLTSCSPQNNDSSESNIDSETTLPSESDASSEEESPSEPSETESEEIPSEEESEETSESETTPSEEDSELEPTTTYTIKKIKEQAQNYIGLENEVGVYESNFSVTLNLKLLACLDAITTQKGYGDRYKILMSDGEDYIYLKTTYENYDYLKKYVTNQGVYSVTGNISIYNLEVELTVKEKPIYLEEETITFTSDKAPYLSIENIYSAIDELTLNSKGIAFSKLVKTNVICLAKDINNTNLYFGSGDYIINVHGHDKVTNRFTVGNSYELVGALSMHNFRPGLEFVSSKYIQEDVSFTTDNIENKTSSDFYKYTYEVDKHPSYENYTHLFQKPYKVTGYLNAYLKDSKYYIVLDDTLKENYYSTYTSARSGKAAFFVNENYVKISDIERSDIFEPLNDGLEVEVIVFPYLWNNNDYPQVYAYDISYQSNT